MRAQYYRAQAGLWVIVVACEADPPKIALTSVEPSYAVEGLGETVVIHGEYPPPLVIRYADDRIETDRAAILVRFGDLRLDTTNEVELPSAAEPKRLTAKLPDGHGLAARDEPYEIHVEMGDVGAAIGGFVVAFASLRTDPTEQRLKLGAPCQPITVSLTIDHPDGAIPFLPPVTVALAASDPKVEITDVFCTMPISVLELESGHGQFGLKGVQPGMAKVTVSTERPAKTAEVLVEVEVPVQRSLLLERTSGQPLVTGACVELSVTRLEGPISNRRPDAAGSTLPLALSNDSNDKLLYFTGSGCMQPIPSGALSVPAGSAALAFSVQPLAARNYLLTVTTQNADYSPATISLGVSDPGAPELTLVGPPEVEIGACANNFSVSVRDANDAVLTTPTALVMDIQVALSSGPTPFEPPEVFVDESCARPALGQIFFAANSPLSAPIFVRTPVGGMLRLIVSADLGPFGNTNATHDFNGDGVEMRTARIVAGGLPFQITARVFTSGVPDPTDAACAMMGSPSLGNQGGGSLLLDLPFGRGTLQVTPVTPPPGASRAVQQLSCESPTGLAPRGRRALLIGDCAASLVPPRVELIRTPPASALPVPIQLTANFTTSPGNQSSDSCEWDFDGDGSFDLFEDRAATLSHNYPQAGLYHPIVLCRDANGCPAYAERPVMITGDPRALITTNRPAELPLLLEPVPAAIGDVAAIVDLGSGDTVLQQDLVIDRRAFVFFTGTGRLVGSRSKNPSKVKVLPTAAGSLFDGGSFHGLSFDVSGSDVTLRNGTFTLDPAAPFVVVSGTDPNSPAVQIGPQNTFTLTATSSEPAITVEGSTRIIHNHFSGGIGAIRSTANAVGTSHPLQVFGNVFAQVATPVIRTTLFQPAMIWNNTFYENSGVGPQLMLARPAQNALSDAGNNLFVRGEAPWAGDEAPNGSGNLYYAVADCGLACTVVSALLTELMVDPLFVDPANEDFRLRSQSCAIDSGFDTAFVSGLDINGPEPERFDHEAPETGAFEVPFPRSDTNCN